MARKKTFSAAGDLQFQQAVAPEERNLKPAEESSRDYAVIEASLIVPSPYNEGLEMENMDEYVRSLKENGLIEPITVYALPDGTYEILSGHQRFEAWCRLLGNATIKAFVLPYEKDPVKRFKAHSEANILHRDTSNLNYWLTRIDMAKRVLEQTGFAGSKADMMDKISGMLGGISKPQLYRYESFRKLIPELQELERQHCLSANTLYAAVSLDAIQQREVRRRVDELLDVKKRDINDVAGDAEVTREEFNRIVSEVKNGAPSRHARRRASSTFDTRLQKASDSFISAASKCRTLEEREQARQHIAELRLKLDELEKALG